jgi:hypothetical protein
MVLVARLGAQALMAGIQGLDALVKRLNAIGEPHPVLRAAQIKTISEAQALVHRKTGHLQRSIVPGPITATHARVEARTPYAASLELGARRHRIPKIGNAKAPMPLNGSRRLSGNLRTGGKPTAFAWHVDHPGNKPYPYLIPGAKKAVASIKDMIVTLWNQAA